MKTGAFVFADEFLDGLEAGEMHRIFSWMESAFEPGYMLYRHIARSVVYFYGVSNLFEDCQYGYPVYQVVISPTELKAIRTSELFEAK